MAGRGTDIMLGGNSEFLAKQEMKANKVPENLIEESNTYYETDDQDILRARETFKKLDEKYQEQIKEEKEKSNSCRWSKNNRNRTSRIKTYRQPITWT